MYCIFVRRLNAMGKPRSMGSSVFSSNCECCETSLSRWFLFLLCHFMFAFVSLWFFVSLGVSQCLLCVSRCLSLSLSLSVCVCIRLPVPVFVSLCVYVCLFVSASQAMVPQDGEPQEMECQEMTPQAMESRAFENATFRYAS